MKTAKNSSVRKDRLIHERVQDPYKSKEKPAEPNVCPDCNAVFRGGRWQWAESWPADARHDVCPACRRARDGCPAGLVTIQGGYSQAHKDEILNLARNHEREEKAGHRLHRIMKLDESPTGIRFQTTDIR